MEITQERKQELDRLCHKFRKNLIQILYEIQTGHPGGSLSVCEILTTLYFQEADIAPTNQKDPKRDKVVLCKGHAAPMLYLILAEKGFFSKEDLKGLRQIGSHLQGHPCSRSTPGVEASTGPLGYGYAQALGMALADQADKRESYTYAVLGDGELNEGIVWETCLNASKFQADHLITVVDWNKVQLDGTTRDIMPMGDLKEKFSAFGYYVAECDGHDISALVRAIKEAKKEKGVPSVILAHTVKGKGISFMEGKNVWHGKAINKEEYKEAMKELGGE